MAVIRPFKALKPTREMASKVAALPYDVYSRAEARRVVENNPYSFLAIDRSETQFPADHNMYAADVYRKADSMIQEWTQKGIFVEDKEPCYYLWEMSAYGHTQTGLVACSAIDDYLNGVIRRHENTIREKETDRTNHINVTSAQTGPIFLAYRNNQEIRDLIGNIKMRMPDLVFTSEGIVNSIWKIGSDAEIIKLTEAFGRLKNTYIADGHHRAASAVSVSLARRRKYPDYTGEEEFNYFLSVLFPDDELHIIDYNRVLKDLNGYSPRQILEKLSDVFEVGLAQKEQVRPRKKGEMGFYMDGKWYRLEEKDELKRYTPVGILDVYYLQVNALNPIWDIRLANQKARVDYVGGIRGLDELERRCAQDCRAAFALYPTSIQELMAVADAGQLMPQKSTWFEPKLLSGLFIHRFER